MVRRGSLRVFLALFACFALGAALFAGSAFANAVQPYGYNDAGGFRNVLPPGENGLDTLPQVLEYKSSKSIPKHFDDQQPLYENLLYGAPTLTDEQVPSYYKDATFGVAPGEVESSIEPKPGVTILRDKAYGIPHIYGETRADTMFGAGYAGAADRLFLMDVLRHTGRAESAAFLGGSNAAADAGQWAFAPYTEADLEEQIHEMETEHGAPGKQAVEDLDNYVEGINAYIAAANLDPKLKPAEYSFINKPMEPWKPTDIIAIASLVGGIFGKGGGNELHSALTMEAMVERMGGKAGRKAWEG
ncbi:MAG TPA: penicillin acylase family protein, partial [Solirubrobacterales bacterium]